MTAQPRLVISAPSSGHGKTAIAVGLLAAIAARGLPAAGFKVGPDHTDAAYLGLAAGRPGRNRIPGWSARRGSRRCSRTARPARRSRSSKARWACSTA
jgi:cobyrinic acid a,c-diamide synthase